MGKAMLNTRQCSRRGKCTNLTIIQNYSMIWTTTNHQLQQSYMLRLHHRVAIISFKNNFICPHWLAIQSRSFSFNEAIQKLPQNGLNTIRKKQRADRHSSHNTTYKITMTYKNIASRSLLSMMKHPISAWLAFKAKVKKDQ